MDILFIPILRLLITVINFYTMALFVYVILSMLEQFGVINRYNKVVFFIHNFLFRLCEPVLSRIRLFMPNLGGIDLSPMVLILALYFFQDVLIRIIIKFPT